MNKVRNKFLVVIIIVALIMTAVCLILNPYIQIYCISNVISNPELKGEYVVLKLDESGIPMGQCCGMLDLESKILTVHYKNMELYYNLENKNILFSLNFIINPISKLLGEDNEYWKWLRFLRGSYISMDDLELLGMDSGQMDAGNICFAEIVRQILNDIDIQHLHLLRGEEINFSFTDGYTFQVDLDQGNKELYLGIPPAKENDIYRISVILRDENGAEEYYLMLREDGDIELDMPETISENVMDLIHMFFAQRRGI